MNDPLQKYENPPLIESVISVQFSPLQKYRNPHSGWFWKQFLGKEWTEIEVAPTIPDQFEKFGPLRRWMPEGPTLQFHPGVQTDRTQYVRKDEERMLQVQNSRLIYNWRKRAGTYPTFDILFSEFSSLLFSFKEFIAAAELGEMQQNQWELTYVNHIPKGDLWSDPGDWSQLMPSFRPIVTDVSGQTFDAFNGEWHYDLDGDRGRLHINIRKARLVGSAEKELLIVQQTARGEIDDAKEWSLAAGLSRGREAIDRSFASLFNKTVQDVSWRRQTS